MTYEKIFAGVKKALNKADTSGLEREFAIQCNIQGEGAGSFYIAFKGGVFEVEPYDYKDNDAHLYASGETFIDMFTGKISGKQAFDQGILGLDGSVDAVLSLEKLSPVSEKKKAEKPASKPEEKPKPAPKPEPKPAPKAEIKPAPKPEPKPAPKAEIKPEPKPAEVKPAPKPEAKTEVKPEAEKPKPVEVKPAVKPAVTDPKKTEK